MKDPVTVTLNLPVLLATHDSVEEPRVPRIRFVGFREQVNPLVRVTELERLTVPVRPFCAVTVMVELPLPPMLEIMTDVGLAPIVKSPATVTVIAAVEFVIALFAPPAALTIALYDPGVEDENLHVDCAVPALGTIG